MSKTTVASALKKNPKSRVGQLTKTYEIGVCCSKCAVEAPDGPKGEYYLLGQTPFVDEGICFSGHPKCDRDWMLARKKFTVVWSHVRPIYENSESLGNILICEFAAAGKKCSSGEMCVKAHSLVEYEIWVTMIKSGLTYEAVHGIILEEIENYVTKSTSKCYNTISGDPEMPVAASDRDEKPTLLSIPEDAVRPSSRYEEQGFLVSVNKKTYMAVRVTCADGPDRFFFQMVDNLERMKKCWKDMDVFYKSEDGEKYKMIEEDLMRSLPIAAKFWTSDRTSFSWRRGEIFDYGVGKKCLVQNVDDGNMALMELDDMRLLRTEYFMYKKQAIEAAAAYVYPSQGDQWTPEAIEATRLYFGKWPLVAEVVGSIDNRIALMVCDTTDPNTDVYLADVLIKGGYGIARNNVQPLEFRAKDQILMKND